jgi:hypothetical protein
MGAPGLADFSIASADAVNPLLDGTVDVITPGSNVTVNGRFSGADFLSGTYLAGEAGTFQAVGSAQSGPTYVFFPAVLGTPGDPATAAFSDSDPLAMDGSGNVTGPIPDGGLTGTVSGASFTGTVSEGYCSRGRCHFSHYPVTGTVSNTPSGYELDMTYSPASGSVVAVTTLGCRVN